MSSTVAVGYQPFLKQLAFHLCPADWLFWGGAAGGGKSRAQLEEHVRTCVAVPGANTVMFRRELDQLDQLMADSKEIVPQDLATWNASDHKWTFKRRPNPWCAACVAGTCQGHESTFLFDSMPNKGDEEAHQGPEYDLISFDEATHFSIEQLGFLQARRRSAVPGPGRNNLNWARIRHTSNPGNVSHLYFLTEFVSPPYQDVELHWFLDDDTHSWQPFPEGATGAHVGDTELPWYSPALGKDQDQDLGWWRRTDIEDERLYHYVVWRPQKTDEDERRDQERIRKGQQPLPRPTRCFIQAFLRDNPIYDEDGSYEAELRANPDKNLMRAQLFGRWDVFAGQFFSSFDPSMHVIDPIDPPHYWEVWGSVDYATGKSGALASHWATQDPGTNQIIVYDEFYTRGDKVTDAEACRHILRKSSGRHVGLRLADPSMWHGASRQNAMSAADIWADNGVPLDKANNDRQAGWQRIKDLLAINPATGQPGMVITRNCTNLIQQLQLAVYSDHNEFDIKQDKHLPDHALDSTRYLCMAGRTRVNAMRGRIRSLNWARST